MALNLSLYQCYSSEAIEILYHGKDNFRIVQEFLVFRFCWIRIRLRPGFDFRTFLKLPLLWSHRTRLSFSLFVVNFGLSCLGTDQCIGNTCRLVVRSLIDELHKDSSVGLREAMAPT